jgi:simple sugar transport system permease protein
MRKANPLARALGDRRWQFITIPVFSILLSLLAVSIIFLLLGKNPLVAFLSILQGAGWIPKPRYSAFKGSITDFLDTIDAMTPMLFAALSVAAAFKAGLFNIGVSGQMLLAGFAASMTVGYSSLPAAAARPLALLVGLVAGALAGGLIGVLKNRFNTNEVVSSIMLNYIFQYSISFLINANCLDPVSRQSKAVSPSSRLTLMDMEILGYRMRMPICILLAVIAAVLLHLFLFKTKHGFELRAAGLNKKAAAYAGMGVGRAIISSMTISGALAGLAGVTYYMGHFNSIQPNTLSNLGFDSIAVSLLGNSHPLGIIATSALITTLDRGSAYMSSTVGARQEIASLVTGMILLFSACGSYMRHKVEQAARKGGADA